MNIPNLIARLEQSTGPDRAQARCRNEARRSARN